MKFCNIVLANSSNKKEKGPPEIFAAMMQREIV